MRATTLNTNNQQYFNQMFKFSKFSHGKITKYVKSEVSSVVCSLILKTCQNGEVRQITRFMAVSSEWEREACAWRRVKTHTHHRQIRKLWIYNMTNCSQPIRWLRVAEAVSAPLIERSSISLRPLRTLVCIHWDLSFYGFKLWLIVIYIE